MPSTMMPELNLSEIGTLKPDWLELEAKLGSRPRIDLSPPVETIREALRQKVKAAAESSPSPSRKRLDITDVQVKSLDDEEITLRTYRPTALQDKTLPVCLFYHGGGFVLGDVDREDALCCEMADEVGIVVVSVGYRHGPEFPYPAAVEDAYAGLLWVFDNYKLLGGDSSLICTVGNSAGGLLATAVVRKLRNSGRPERVAAQVLRVPNTCHPKAQPASISGPESSYHSMGNAPILTGPIASAFWALYKVPDDKVRSLDCSPLLATEFDQFPPTYISVCGVDPLRDEALEYARKLEGSGVTVKLEIMSGYPHGFFQWTELNSAKEAAVRFLEGIRWAIDQAQSRK